MNIIILLALLVPMQLYGALRFNGSQVCNNNIVGPLDITNEISIACWATKERSDGGMLVSKNAPLDRNIQQYAYGFTNNFIFVWANPNGTFHRWVSSGSVANRTNEFHHYAVTFSFVNSNSIQMYIDGISVSGSWIAPVDTVGINNIHVNSFGGDLSTSGHGVHAGEVNEIAIWNGIITPGQVYVLAKSRVKRMPIQIRPDILKVYYECNESPGFVAIGDDFVFQNRSTLYDQNRLGAFIGTSIIQQRERTLSYYPNE